MANNQKKQPKSTAPWWVALATGMGLIIFPEPATTALGLLIVGTTLGVGAIETATGAKK